MRFFVLAALLIISFGAHAIPIVLREVPLYTAGSGGSVRPYHFTGASYGLSFLLDPSGFEGCPEFFRGNITPIIGCHPMALPGQAGVFELGPTNDPNWSNFVAALTDDVDSRFGAFGPCFWSGAEIRGGSCGGGGEFESRVLDGLLTPDVAASIAFVRLLLAEVVFDPLRDESPLPYEYYSQVRGTWEIWGTPGPNFRPQRPPRPLSEPNTVVLSAAALVGLIAVRRRAMRRVQ